MKSTIKNAFRLFGIVALAAAIVFSMVACDDGSGGPGGGGSGGGGDGGRLTITGLPQGTWSVNVYAAGAAGTNFPASSSEAFGSINSSRNYALLSSAGSGAPWRGSGNKDVLLIGVVGGTSTGRMYATANFSNGIATVPWSSFRELD